MKRVREWTQEEADPRDAALPVVPDWLRLFHDRCILMVLAPYLSLADIIHLSCVNKKMYYDWVHHAERVDVLQLRERIRDATGRKYTKKMPLKVLRGEAMKARVTILPRHGKKFICFWCRKSRTSMNLGNRAYFPYATCLQCINGRFTHLWTPYASAYLEREVMNILHLGPISTWPVPMRDCVLSSLGNGRPLLEFRTATDCYYFHSSYFLCDLRLVLQNLIDMYQNK